MGIGGQIKTMIRTWIADIRPLYNAECYLRYYKELPAFRKEKADRMRFPKGKAQSAGAWTLLESVRREYGVAEKAAFNLSHSGDYVLCSVDMDCVEDVQVGCDIESIKDANLKVARRFFCPSEYEEILRGEDSGKQSDTFCRFWVLKESFMKATHQGMAMDMGSFEIRLSQPPILLKKPEAFPREYYYREYTLSQIPYKIAVCSTDKKIDSEIHTELKFG